MFLTHDNITHHPPLPWVEKSSPNYDGLGADTAHCDFFLDFEVRVDLRGQLWVDTSKCLKSQVYNVRHSTGLERERLSPIPRLRSSLQTGRWGS